jgi:hypothetical protein
VIPRRLNSLLLLFVSRGLTIRTKHNCTVLIENSVYAVGDYNVDNHGLLLHGMLHRPVSYKITHASFDFSDGNRSPHPV